MAETDQSIRLAIVDDHRMLLGALTEWIRGAAPDIELVAAVASWSELLAHPGFPVDVVLLDLDLRDNIPISLKLSMLKTAGVQVKDINVTLGGCAFWHAVISIRKQAGEGKNALIAALSVMDLKHVVVVDEDIDVFDPTDVEWAIATRVQGEMAGYEYLELVGGPSVRVGDSTTAFVAGGVGLNDAFGTPDWRALAGVRHELR